jgi:hypothetical protein
MLTKLLKSFLAIVENPKSLPNFIGLYLITWLFWHNQLIIEFFNAQGTITARLSTAITAIESFQYLAVFLLTILLFILRIGFDAFISSSRKYVNKKEQENDQDGLQNDKDIERLLATLEETREQLKASKDREKRLKQTNNENINKLLKLQAKLDEVNADKQLLMQINQK